MRVKRYSTDIVIAGGGLAGVISAISAAEEDVQVLLIEKNSFLGGTSTAAMVGEMNATSKDGKNYVSKTGQNIISHLMKENAGLLFVNEPMSSNPHIKVDRIRYNGEYLKIILDRMAKERSIQVLFNSSIDHIKSINQNNIKAIVSTNYEKIYISSKILIDATGNAECVYLLKGKTIVNKKSMNQPASLIFRVGGVDISKFRIIHIDEIKKIIAKGYEKGILPGKILALAEIPGTGEVTINATRSTNLDHESIEDISRALIETREQIYYIMDFLKKNMQGFKYAYLSAIGTDIGIRDRRRITGVYELTGEDIIKGKKFSDAIAVGTYPVDIHKNKDGAIEFTEIENEGVYTIPYRSLITGEFDNVIVSGKCISADNVSFGSIRVIGTIMNIAEAAGAAANLAVKQNKSFHEIEVSQLQNILRSKGMKI